MAAVPKAYRRAAERWGYLVDSQARKLGLPNGATLLAKIASGESSFNTKAVSSAGAKGATQFMPETRSSFLKKYGVDAWGGPEDAIHATALFVRDLGFAAYNPGSPTYTSYILSQPVAVKSELRKGARQAQAVGSNPAIAEPVAPSSSGSSMPGGLQGDLMHAGLVFVLVLGGIGMVGFGAVRSLRGRPA